MNAKIKSRVEELIADYIAACGGALNCWLAHNEVSEKWRGTKLQHISLREPNFDTPCKEGWSERVSVNLVRALLMKCRRRVDHDGRTLIARLTVIIDNESVRLGVFMSGWRDDEQLAKEIEDAYRSRGNRFEPFDNRPRLSMESADTRAL